MKKRKLLTLLAGAIVMLALAAAPVMADLAAGVTLDFNANDPASGVSGSGWNSLTAENGYNFTFGADVTLESVSGIASLSKAYRFTGGAGSNTTPDWSPLGDQKDATWELWIKPSDTGDATQTIFETGGSGDGMAIWYERGTASDNQGTVHLTIDNQSNKNTVSAVINTSDFHHIVVTYDKDSDGSLDLMQMYADGILVDDNTDQAGNTGIGDWSGTDDGALGRTQNSLAETAQGGAFQGYISIFRFWGDRALTEAEVVGNYDLYVDSGPEILRPEHGAVVAPGEVTFEWINLDPNGATETYVDVWFGTDPNKVTGPGAGTYTKVVNGENISLFALTPDGPGVYYWQVDSYCNGKPTTAGGTVDYSSGDPCMVAGRVYMFTNDGPIESVDAGPDMITWVGEPVYLVADVNDDGGSALTYAWTIDLPNDVTAVVEPSADVAVTSVTFARGPYTNANIVNAGFEAVQTGEPPSDWGPEPATGWDVIGRNGTWNPPADAYTDSAVPEGQMCAWAQKDASLIQVLSETLAADNNYSLTVEVGNSNKYDWTGYKVQLLAGGVVIAEDNSSLHPALGTFETSTVNYSYSPEDANKVGLPLEIRLVAGGLPAGYAECNFDAVQLTADPPFPTPEGASTVDVTLTVNDVLNPAVSDTMTIEIYDDACEAARIGQGKASDNLTDFDTNCITDIQDLALMAAKWLDDNAATGPITLMP